MEINFLGHSCFRLKGKTTIVITDPYDPNMVGLKLAKLSGDVVTISHDHGDHNQSELVGGVKKVVSGPGEYEIMGVSIVGISTYHDEKKGTLRGKNTVYIIEIDGLRVAHLGDLGHKLNDKILEKIGTIDVLLIPVGGEFTIGPQQAVEIVRAIEPTVVIPMHYQFPGLKANTFAKLVSADEFISDLGVPSEKLDKLNIKKEIIGEDQRVVVLEKK